MRIRIYIWLLLCILLFSLMPASASSSVNEVIINGTLGNGKGQVNVIHKQGVPENIEPQAIAIDSKGNVYVDDPGNMRIMKFNSVGEHVLNINRDLGYGGKDLGFHDLIRDSYISDIAVDEDNNIYVLSQNLKRIEMYNSEGGLLKNISLNNLIDEVIRKGNIYLDELMRTYIDGIGNIYLKNTYSQLFKIDGKGGVKGIWNAEGYITPSFYIDLYGNLFIKNKSNVEKYDANGKRVSSGPCNKIMPFNPKCLDVWLAFDGGYILADGYHNELGNTIANFLIVDRNGKEIGRFRDPLMFGYSPLGSSGSNVKFDKYGNYYNLLVHYNKKYWVERYDIEKILKNGINPAQKVFLPIEYKGGSKLYDANMIDLKSRGNYVLDVEESAQKLFIRLLRNEIFARHGRIFKSEDLKKIFEATDWYKPDPNYSDDMLNDIEKKNVQFILDYEKKMGWKE